MEDKVIQTIVMRTKFPDGNGGYKKLRQGKNIAQGAHSSIAFLTNKIRKMLHPELSDLLSSSYEPFLSEEELEWIEGAFTKICLYVDTEEELLDVYNRAKEAKLTVYLIEDSGLTEFNGEKTTTCLAIGPHYKSKIDPITENLKLF